MKLPIEKQVCSLETAKRLRELGVEQESLWYRYDKTDTITNNSVPECLMYAERYSAFTAYELGEMLKEYGNFESGWYGSSYYCIHDMAFMDYIPEGETEADARAKMLIYLIEHKVITV